MELLFFMLAFSTDRLSKIWAGKNLRKGEIKAAAGNKVYFTLLENYGLPNGIMSERPGVVKAVSFFGFFLSILYAAFGLKGSPKLARLGYFTMLGGGLSNFLDRVFRGSVTDFICFKKDGKKTVYNLADFFIFAGAATVVASSRDTQTDPAHSTWK